MGSSPSKIENDQCKKKKCCSHSHSPTIVVTKEVEKKDSSIPTEAKIETQAEAQVECNDSANQTGNNKSISEVFEKAIGSAINAGLFGEETCSSMDSNSDSADEEHRSCCGNTGKVEVVEVEQEKEVEEVEEGVEVEEVKEVKVEQDVEVEQEEEKEIEVEEKIDEMDVEVEQEEEKELEEQEKIDEMDVEVEVEQEEEQEIEVEQEKIEEKIEEVEEKEIDEMIKDLSIGLTEISIFGKQLHLDSEDDVKNLCQDIKANFSSIESIILSGNTLGIEACRAISVLLPSLKKLKSFNMSDCFTSRKKDVVHVCLELICEGLMEMVNNAGGPHLSTLRFIDFSDNAFGPPGAKAVSLFLSKCSSGLESLIMNNQGLGPDGGNIIMNSILESASEDGRLAIIEMGRTRLENDSCEAIAKVLKAFSSSLREVSLPQNGIRPEGISILAKNGLSHCKDLTSLNLQDNTFTVVGSLALAECFESMGSDNFKSLNVSDCLLSQEGAMSILDVLSRKCPNITNLDLQFNEIEYNFVEGLSLLISSGKFSSLKKIYLNGNSFDPKLSHVNVLKGLIEENGGELDSLCDNDFDGSHEECMSSSDD